MAAEIRGELDRQGVSAEELSARAGIPMSALDSKLTGEDAFTVEDLDRIASALGAPPAQFLRE